MYAHVSNAKGLLKQTCVCLFVEFGIDLLVIAQNGNVACDGDRRLVYAYILNPFTRKKHQKNI
jgi:hypothetical protein